ncbi:ATPASE EXPRESSION PROTEIN 3 [Salix koriyanagi]|uniref:ATPASE EXPRESSION PROTEIN 3 n=1 Tax=Salix koriyanagi TaxID=2511006 RepID=A0A9Q1A896_9ROSI|nr:ATPASE EXPRESSION PROTEIN 3 [Salix koriyanagi]
MKMLNRSWKAGKCNGSLYFLECMVTKGYQPDVMCTKLIKGFFNSRNTEKAARVMEILEKHGKPDVFAYNAVISGFCKANRIESANKVLDRMKRKGFSQDVVTFNIMIVTFCSQGKIDLASKVFEELLRDNNCKPTLITCMILMEAHILEGGIDEGKWYEGEKLVNVMFSRG